MNPAAPSNLQNLNDQQRKTLIDSIRSGECVLVLGPYANLADDGQALQVRLVNYLVQNLPVSDQINASEQDDLRGVICRILLKYTRNDIKDAMTAFYQQQKGRDVKDTPYEIILKMRFRTIFSTDLDSHLIKTFEALNLNPMGLYFTQATQADIVPFRNYHRLDDPTEDRPVILNLFGLYDDDKSLAIGPDEELRQLYALTSDEISNKINKLIGERLSKCPWYLFVGFNFNSWVLRSIFYFHCKLNKNIKDARVYGLHSPPDFNTAPLTKSTVAYYKKLLPLEHNENDVQIVHSDAKTFFKELQKLYDQFPPPPPPVSRFAFVLFHPRDRDRLDSTLQALEAKFQEFDLTVQYSELVTAFDQPLTPDQIRQHTLKDDVVLYFLSTNWEDIKYDQFLDLAQQRSAAIKVHGVLLDKFNIYQTGQPRSLKPLFKDGTIRLLNGQRPLVLPDGLDGFVCEVDEILRDNYSHN